MYIYMYVIYIYICTYIYIICTYIYIIYIYIYVYFSIERLFYLLVDYLNFRRMTELDERKENGIKYL